MYFDCAAMETVLSYRISIVSDAYCRLNIECPFDEIFNIDRLLCMMLFEANHNFNGAVKRGIKGLFAYFAHKNIEV